MGLLDGQTAIVTGAAAGIGAGIALGLAEAGADIAICDVQEAKGEAVAERIRSATGRAVHWMAADVRDADQVKRFVDTSAEVLGGLDIVVSNAGTWQPTDARDQSYEDAVADWAVLVDTNLRGLFLTGRASIPHLLARGGGNIVNIATDHICPPPGAGKGGGTRMDIYDASKFGIDGLTHAWSRRLGADGIRVNAICMDAVDSEMTRKASGDFATEEVIAAWMTPADVAGLVLDLLAEGPDGRTGENLGMWLGHEVALPPRAEVLPQRHP